jgi:hypothetical protein
VMSVAYDTTARGTSDMYRAALCTALTGRSSDAGLDSTHRGSAVGLGNHGRAILVLGEPRIHEGNDGSHRSAERSECRCDGALLSAESVLR